MPGCESPVGGEETSQNSCAECARLVSPAVASRSQAGNEFGNETQVTAENTEVSGTTCGTRVPGRNGWNHCTPTSNPRVRPHPQADDGLGAGSAFDARQHAWRHPAHVAGCVHVHGSGDTGWVRTPAVPYPMTGRLATRPTQPGAMDPDAWWLYGWSRRSGHYPKTYWKSAKTSHYARRRRKAASPIR